MWERDHIHMLTSPSLWRVSTGNSKVLTVSRRLTVSYKKLLQVDKSYIDSPKDCKGHHSQEYGK